MTQSDPCSNRLLLVEDSISFSYCIKAKLEKEMGLEIVLAPSLAEARRAVEIYQGRFFLALLDLNLPDASGDEVALLASEHQIPSIVFTASCSDTLRDRLFALGMIDYLNKDNPQSLECVDALVKRMHANARWTALVVDDSATQRRDVAGLLRKYRFNVIEATSGGQALKILEQEPNIRLVTTDFNMPGMDGCELTRAIRRKFSPERLAIIGISGQASSPLTARFLKNGANDFLIKPFVREEFFCRITQNMDNLDLVDALRQASSTDPVTNLPNRRHFFELADAFAAQSERDWKDFAIGLIDIDGFKKINDQHGHIVGDQALAHAARVLKKAFGRSGDVVARFGAASFGVFLHDTEQETARSMLELARAALDDAPMRSAKGAVRMTASAGLCAGVDIELSEMVDLAERALEFAKSAGGDQLIVAEDRGLNFVDRDGALRLDQAG